MRKRHAIALAAAGVALVAAAAWWIDRASSGGEKRRRSDAASLRPEAPSVPTESAAAPTDEAVRTENRGVADLPPDADEDPGPEALADPTSNWVWSAKESGIEFVVLDESTHEPLRDVTIEAGAENYASATSREPPGGGPHALEIVLDGDRKLEVRGDSPVRHPFPGRIRRSRTRFLIGAPGHATVARWFDVSISGWRRHVVALPPAGALDVVVRGSGRASSGVVELYDVARLEKKLAGGAADVARLLGDGGDPDRLLRGIGADFSLSFASTPEAPVFERRFEAIRGGDWVGVARVDDGVGVLEWGTGRVRIEASSSRPPPPARLEIALRARPAPRFAHVRGTVRFAAGWTVDEIVAARWLRFFPLDPRPRGDNSPAEFSGALESTGQDHVLHFDSGWQRGGRYSATITEIPAVFAAEIEGVSESRNEPGGDGGREFELFVDEPATVVVQVRRRVELESDAVLLRFFGGAKELRHAEAGGRIATRPDGSIRLPRVPRGPFHVELEPGQSLPGLGRDLELVVGENSVEFDVTAPSGILLVLREGRVPVPWIDGIEVTVAPSYSPKDDLESVRRTTVRGRGCQVELEPGCRYLVTLRNVPGYADPESVEVVVNYGEFTPVEIALPIPR